MTLINVTISWEKVSGLNARQGRNALFTIFLVALTPVIASAQSTSATPPPPPPPVNLGITNFPAPPPTGKAGGLQDVVITARHRAERAQSVPISMTVVGSQQLKNLGPGPLNLAQIKQLVPSLAINAFNPRNIGLDIRSLGSVGFFGYDGLEGGVGVYEDGVLLGRSTETNFDLPDLQDIEVLRGPQGTLFGKNTVAGAVVINSKLPSFTPHEEFTASYGNYNYWQLLGYATGALGNSGKAAFSLTTHVTQDNGYIYNTLNGERFANQDDKGVRGQLLLEPNANLTVRIIANYDHSGSNCCVNVPTGVVTKYANGTPVKSVIGPGGRYTNVGYSPAINPFLYQNDPDSYNHYAMETAGASIQADYDWNGFTLTSITGGSYYNWYPHLDGDGLAIPILTAANNTTHQRQFSQEFRLTSPGGGVVDYTTGLYGFYQQLNDQAKTTYGSDAAAVITDTNPNTPTPIYTATNTAINGISSLATDIPSTYSYAAYGQATYHITPQIDLTGGARITYEDKTGQYYTAEEGGAAVTPGSPSAIIRGGYAPVGIYDFNVSAFDTLPGWLATLSYKPIPGILAYATYSYGEKSAGLNFINSLTIPKVVKPESVDNYEIGVKTTLLNGNILLNGDLFLETDQDYQSTIVGPAGPEGTLAAYLANIPQVRSQGAEIDSRFAITSNLNAFFSGIYNEAYYQSNPSSPCPIELKYLGHSLSCD